MSKVESRLNPQFHSVYSVLKWLHNIFGLFLEGNFDISDFVVFPNKLCKMIYVSPYYACKLRVLTP